MPMVLMYLTVPVLMPPNSGEDRDRDTDRDRDSGFPVPSHWLGKEGVVIKYLPVIRMSQQLTNLKGAEV